MVKTISYTCLHYGLAYLEYALRSVRDYVDECHVAYTPIGSHGHRTSVRCPESRDDLLQAAQRGAGDKLRWYEGVWPHEGAHRESIFQRCPDADVIIVVDSDEIWNDQLVAATWNLATNHAEVDRRYWRIPMVHYWRSFSRCVIDDQAYPVRVIFPRVPDGEHYYMPRPLDGRYKTLAINHMGYAQPVEITRYKIETHGHRGEWRSTWFTQRFLPNAQADCHPTNLDYWQPVTVDPLDYMPGWMREHPYYNLDIIR